MLGQSIAKETLAPEPLRSADLAAAAEAMIPLLRETSPRTNADRRPPPELCAQLKAAGFPRMFQPARYGGAQGALTDGVDTLRAIGRGCGSTAWIVVQNMMHNLMIAHWPKEAQDAAWGASPDMMASGILIPGVGRARKVEGGYTLSGRWPFVSGVDVSDWVIFTGDVHLPDGTVEDRHFLVPRAQVEIIDTWYTIGLKGSASNDVALNELFIPAHMSITMEQLKGHGRSPGSKVNTAPLYQIPPYAIFGCYIGSAQLGIAEAAVEHYVTHARKRAATMSSTAMASYVTQQVKVAEAQTAVRAARELIYSVVREVEALFAAGGQTTLEDRTRYRAMATYAGKLAASAVNIVVEAGGGTVIYDRNPVSLCVSDMTVANRHTTQNWDVNASTYGRVLLGLPSGVPAFED
ncbi:acyl-CoA dehydrogenase family protein [Ancylobacter sp. G4_0304]|uniref:acyl-CoA dehydrogenase family protein n=1 Tax=Ancylobacter sp. G4_0304 TaxID=3114289 RepID=UPI0039C705E7